MNIFYLIFAAVTLITILLDTFFYPTFSLRHILIDAIYSLFMFTALTLFLATQNLLDLPPKILKINKKYIFPFLTCTAILLIAIEKLQHNNFVFSSIHINPFVFIYLPVLSGIILFASTIRAEHKHKLFIYLPAIFLPIIYSLPFINEQMYLFLVSEDSLFESVQFIFIAIASIYAFKSFLHSKKHNNLKIQAIIFLILSVGLFFMAGEEISWGQRIFNVITPESIEKVNAQGEINIHNLNTFQGMRHIGIILIALYGTFSRIILEKFGTRYKKYIVFTPPYTLFFSFFWVALFYFIGIYGLYIYAQLNDVPNSMLPQHWEEVAETYFAFGLFGYAFLTYKALRN